VRNCLTFSSLQPIMRGSLKPPRHTHAYKHFSSEKG